MSILLYHYGDNMHFLIQSVPTYSPAKICRTVKSLTAREIFGRCPEVGKVLWGGEFWTDGCFISTVGRHENEKTTSDYVRNQGDDLTYRKIHSQQLRLLTLEG